MTKIKVVSKRNCWSFYVPTEKPEKPEKKESEVKNA